jgi:hypothetical protein
MKINEIEEKKEEIIEAKSKQVPISNPFSN